MAKITKEDAFEILDEIINNKELIKKITLNIVDNKAPSVILKEQITLVKNEVDNLNSKIDKDLSGNLYLLDDNIGSGFTTQELMHLLKDKNLVKGTDVFLENYIGQVLEGEKQLIDKIVELEWKQFDGVKNEGGRASCQNDFETFSIMRKSQYLTWTKELLSSYYNDLLLAEQFRLERIIKDVKVRLAQAPEGRLRLSRTQKYLQYYQCTEQNKRGIYIAKNNQEFMERLPVWEKTLGLHEK